jgi:hypothetical protein
MQLQLVHLMHSCTMHEEHANCVGQQSMHSWQQQQQQQQQ